MYDSTLGNFFERPVKLATYAWTVGDPINVTFNPWATFFENPRVSNRICNFNLLRATLHVKVVMTGSNFHYGKALMSYHPLHVYDQFNDLHFPFVKEQNLVNLSQRPHVYLTATGTAGSEMVLPFVAPGNNLSIPGGEWLTMGELSINSFTSLKHANGGNGRVEISIFAWATDVTLSMPTSTPPYNLQPQVGVTEPRYSDEYSGMISGPAGIVEHLSGKLRKVPWIGKYAMATQSIARTIGSTARFFGFSRPTFPEQATPCLAITRPNTVNTNVHDTAIKLTLDCKQETTIDPRVLGLDGTDELAINHIASHESYVHQFTWGTTSPNETVLWSSPVNPMMVRTSTLGFGEFTTGLHMSAMAFAAAPFHYWRGTIVYRFIVVASPYHKGKLTVRYDPRGLVSDEYNVNYLKVIDIEEQMDFEVEVGWANPLPYLEVPRVSDQNTFLPIAEPFSTDRQDYLANPFTNYSNGFLEVAVHNCLTVPTDIVNNDVQVLVTVRAGPDFEVLAPDSTNLDYLSLLEPQSGTTEGDAQTSEGEPNKSNTTLSIAHIGHCPELLAIHDGDPVTSFRQILKRYNLVRTITQPNNNYGLASYTTSDFPHYKGRTTYGVDLMPAELGGVPQPYNSVRTTLLHYVTPAFCCRRGGLRRMYTFPKVTAEWLNAASVTRRLRNTPEGRTYTNVPTAVSDANALRALFQTQLPSGLSGTASTDVALADHLTVELPYHNNRRFSPARRVNWKTPAIGLTSHTLQLYHRQTVDSRHYIQDHVGVAEDFQLHFFIGAPVYFIGTLGDPFPVTMP